MRIVAEDLLVGKEKMAAGDQLDLPVPPEAPPDPLVPQVLPELRGLKDPRVLGALQDR